MKLQKQLLGEPLVGESWASIIKRAFARRIDDGHEVSLRDGKRVGIATRALTTEPGQIILLHDLTETRALQERISHYKRLSQMGKMVASVAHQIRTPLSAAILHASNLNNQSLNVHQQQDFANKILSGLRNIESQVSEMLLFARGGHSVIEAHSIDAIFSELTSRVSDKVHQSSAQLHVKQDSGDSILHCNQEAILGALQNLINNALEISTTDLHLQLRAVIVDEHHVKISLQDNGPGINTTIQEKIFDPFFTTKSNGTGLGLAVVQAVAKAHQGKIVIESTEGEGSEIGFILPLQSHDHTKAVAAVESINISTGE